MATGLSAYRNPEVLLLGLHANMEEQTFPPHIIALAAKVGGFPWSFRETETEVIIVLTTGHKFKFSRLSEVPLSSKVTTIPSRPVPEKDSVPPPASVPQPSPTPVVGAGLAPAPSSKKGGRHR